MYPSDRFILFLFTGNFYRFCYCILRSIFGDATYTRVNTTCSFIRGTFWGHYVIRDLYLKWVHYTQCNNGSTGSMHVILDCSHYISKGLIIYILNLLELIFNWNRVLILSRYWRYWHFQCNHCTMKI